MSCNRKLLCVCLLLAHAAAASVAGVQIAVYWGQNSDESSLAKTCSTGRYAFVLIASLSVFGNLQTPSLDLSAHCNSSANGCAGLAGEIASCQASGVKVLLSIGGSIWSYGLTTDEAQGVASYLWNTYLGGTSRSRPFGNAVLDGIDLDIEVADEQFEHYDELVKNLTALYKQGAKVGKTYLLTAAQGCQYPIAALQAALSTGLFDHVWVQLYSNPSFCTNVSNLRTAWEQWTRALPSASIFLGLLPSLDAAAYGGGGFIDVETLESEVLPVVNKSANYGGIMLSSRYYDMVNGYSSKLLGKGTYNIPELLCFHF